MYVVISAQRLPLPLSLIESQHALRLGLKVRVTRENPTAVLPGPDGIFLQPAPEGSTADAGHQTATDNVPDQIPPAVAGEWQAVLMGQFAGQSFDLPDQFRGEKQADARDGEGFPNHPSVPRRSACATC